MSAWICRVCAFMSEGLSVCGGVGWEERRVRRSVSVSLWGGGNARWWRWEESIENDIVENEVISEKCDFERTTRRANERKLPDMESHNLMN